MNETKFVITAQDRATAVFRNVSGELGRLGSAVTAARSALMSLGTLGAGLSVAGVVSMTKAFVDSGAEITRLAKLSNVTTDEFQKLSAGADLVGIGTDKLADIFKDVQDKVGDFLQNGGGPLKDFFDNIAPQVGVTAEQFRKLSGPQALELYVSSLQKANISQSEMTFYMEAIANDATLLLPLLLNNARGFKEAGDEAARMGAIIDQETLAASEKFRTEMVTLGRQLEGAKVSIFGPLISALAEVVTGFNAAQRAQAGFLKGAALWASIPGEYERDPARGVEEVTAALNRLKKMRSELDPEKGFANKLNDLIFGDVGDLDKQIAVQEARLAVLSNLMKSEIDRDMGAYFGASAPADSGGGGGSGGRNGRPRAGAEVDALKSLIDSSLARDFERLLQDTEALDEVLAEALASDQERLGAAADRWKDLIDPSREYTRQLEEIRDLVASGKLTPEQGTEAEFNVESSRSDALFGDVKDKADEAKDAARELGLTFQSAFEDAVIGGEKLGDVLDGIMQDIARMVIRKSITEPFVKWLGGLLPSADGNVFDPSGHVKRFAAGGIVSGATPFTYAGGLGVMGEAGPEAIMPLKRGRDGKLGVAGGGGATVIQHINVGSGVSYNDVMAAMLAAKEEAKREVYESMRRGGAFA